MLHTEYSNVMLRIKKDNPKTYHIKSSSKLLVIFLCLAVIFAVSFYNHDSLAASNIHISSNDTLSVKDSSDENSSEDPEGTDRKKVRVGWFESKFNHTDQFGRKSGYAYEYQRKIAAYTGWEYEYVEGNWSELLEMLKKGEIDLLGDVSYADERTEEMLYASLPMGAEAYYIYINPNNAEIKMDDVSSLVGKKVGVDKDSVQEEMFYKWTDMQGIDVDLVELTKNQEEVVRMLGSGEIDAFVTLDSFGDPGTVEPVWKVGSAEIFFAVSMDRPDLLKELDQALSKIQDENKNYNQILAEKYMVNGGTAHYLSLDEQDYISKHGKIRVGYQDNYLAFCAKDSKTGELTGALKDYLSYASTGFENAEIEFEPVCYQTAAEAMEALNNGEIDCVFPANLSDYEGEQMNMVMTPPLMTTEMDAIVRSSEKKEFFKKDDITVAVNTGNTNYEMFLVDNYPGWKVAYFDDTPAGLEGVADGDADCVIISNYRYNNISKQCQELHLSSVYTGVDMDYCFAVRENEGELYSILSKTTYVVPGSTTSAALMYYSTEDVKTGFFDVIKDNIIPILLVGILIALIILVLSIRSLRFKNRVKKEHRLVKDLNKKAFTDSLTNVRNKAAFTEYIGRLQKMLENNGDVDFAIGMLDCDNLKKINDTYGHDKGDIYLKGASQLICHVFRNSSVFRIGGDEFSVIIENQDFRNMEGMIRSFYRRKKEICELAENEWDEVNISLGVAIFDPEADENLEDTIRRADKIMYENKRVWKRNFAK